MAEGTPRFWPRSARVPWPAAAGKVVLTEKANDIFDYNRPVRSPGRPFKQVRLGRPTRSWLTRTAWLKVHHPRHFPGRLMTSEMDRTERRREVFIH